MRPRHFLLAVAVAVLASPLACSKPDASGSPAPAPTGPGVHAVTVDDNGFQPSTIALKQGEKAQLVFTRTSDKTCATEVEFPDLHVRKALPKGTPVAIEIPTDAPRTLKFTCGMGMYESKVVVEGS